MPDGNSIGNEILSEGCQTLINATFSPFFLMEIGFNALWCLSSSEGPLNFSNVRRAVDKFFMGKKVHVTISESGHLHWLHQKQ